MVVKCEEVWREVSNYLDGETSPEVRAAIEEHVRGCKRGTAVVDGTRNVIQLYADERVVELPLGFSRRLHQRLEGDMASSRRSFFGWMVAVAAAVLVVGGFEVARSSGFRRPRPEIGTRSCLNANPSRPDSGHRRLYVSRTSSWESRRPSH